MSVMVASDQRLLVVPFDQRIANLFPKAKRVQDYIALPHGAEETRVLRNLGFEAPSPIHNQYEWPGQPPFLAQRVTASLLSVEPRAYVLNGLGTGKTRSVLYAFDFLRSIGEAKRMLVVAPLSTLNFTWRREVFNTFPHLNVVVVYGTAKQRRELLRQPADIYVINHDGMKVVEKEITGAFDTYAFDELTAFRNARSARSKVAKNIIKGAERVWGLTGTPMPKEPTDTFGQMVLINPARAPKSFTHFRNACMLQVSQFKWVPRANAKDYVYGLMQPAVRFALEDCVDMPPVVEINREVTLGTTGKLYDIMMKDLTLKHENHEITAANAGVLRGKLLQISAGVVYDKRGEAVVMDDSDRYSILCELLEQTERPALVFCPWRALVEHVHDRLKGDGYEVEMVYGGTSPKDRERIFAEVQRPRSSLKAVIAHPGTMSHGLNLQGADTIIWYALIDNLETYLQANARIQRPGQTAAKTRLAHLYGTRMERAVLRRLQDRTSMQDALLEMFAE